jgi:hypothetical protein
MASKVREKFATRVGSAILTALHKIAWGKRQQVQVLAKEALANLIEKRKQEHPRSHVIAAYQASHEKFSPLYRKLAE